MTSSHVHRLRPLLELAELAAAEDQAFAVLPRAAGDAALGGDAGLADRVPAAVGAAFAAAQRVVDRVHRLGPRVRADAHVPRAAGLADADVDPVEVAELADRRAALALDPPHFTRRQDDDRPLAFLRRETCHAAGGPDQLAALAGVHLDVVDLEARRDVRQRQAVAGVRLGAGTAHHRLPDLQAVGRQDVGLFAVLVLDQRDVAGTVRVVLQRLDAGGYAVLLPLEVDDPVQPLVPAAPVLDGDHAVVVTTVGAALADRERLLRLELGQRGLVVQHRSGAPAGGGRVVKLDRHDVSVGSRQWAVGRFHCRLPTADCPLSS